MKNFASNGKSLFCLGFLIISMLGTAVAQTFTGPGFTIVDNGGRVAASCSIVAVAGVTTNVTVSSVTLNNLTHGYIGDTETRIYPPGVAISPLPTPPAPATSFALSSPPDLCASTFAGTYTYSDSGSASIDATASATGCDENFSIPAGTYRTSGYGGGTNDGPLTSLTGFFGTLTPAQANGNWNVCVFDFAAPDGGSAASTSITFASPTAAGISISGRVVTPTGEPIRNINLTLTDGNGNVQMTKTSIYGGYVFENLPAGTIYTITASGKRYRFNQPTQFFNGTEDFTGADFVGYSVGAF